ncbi:MAG: PQQ-binding-like beta-propeller repeat protein [Ferruginibacter sp.]
MKANNALYILSKGRVAAISKKNGDIIWEIKLKDHVNNSMTAAIGQISVEGDKIYIGVSGMLICLSTKDGSLVWKNELKGWGYNFVSMADANIGAAAATEQMKASAALVATM